MKTEPKCVLLNNRILRSTIIMYTNNIFHEMKGCRDRKSVKMSATRNCLYGAVVGNDQMYPRPHLHHFPHVSMTPLGSKTL